MEPKVRNRRVLVRELGYYSNSGCVTLVTCALSGILSISCYMYNVHVHVYPCLIMAMYRYLQLYRHTTPLELLALFIAALCHDLDHPGQLHTDYYSLSIVKLVWLITTTYMYMYWAAMVAQLVVHLFRTQNDMVLELKRVPPLTQLFLLCCMWNLYMCACLCNNHVHVQCSLATVPSPFRS